MEVLSRSILVHEVKQPFQLCYNSTFPYLFSLCDPGQGYQCSVSGPTFGCTKDSSIACTEVHLCNAPIPFLIGIGTISLLIIFLITSGCLWCCFCCCCGRCCKNTCPCFAKLSLRPMTTEGRVYPDWTMYEDAGDSIRLDRHQNFHPSAPNAAHPVEKGYYSMAPDYSRPHTEGNRY